jgi:hypothetical protein
MLKALPCFSHKRCQSHPFRSRRTQSTNKQNKHDTWNGINLTSAVIIDIAPSLFRTTSHRFHSVGLEVDPHKTKQKYSTGRTPRKRKRKNLLFGNHLQSIKVGPPVKLRFPRKMHFKKIGHLSKRPATAILRSCPSTLDTHHSSSVI